MFNGINPDSVVAVIYHKNPEDAGGGYSSDEDSGADRGATRGTREAGGARSLPPHPAPAW